MGARGGTADLAAASGKTAKRPSRITLQTQLLENMVRGLSGPDITVAVLDTQGNVLTSTQGLEGATQRVVEPVTAQQVNQALNSSQPVQWTVKGQDGTRHVVVLTTVAPELSGPGQNRQTGTLLVEQSASLAAADAALGVWGFTWCSGWSWAHWRV